ncbi:MAG: hypothetical protein ACK5U7_13775 [Bacteroidota bacterium]|jgi:hypothetical protein
MSKYADMAEMSMKLEAELARLRKIEADAKAAGLIGPDGKIRRVLGTLPVTADGCIVGQGIHAQYHIGSVTGVPYLRMEGSRTDHSVWYSTREAAEAAREEKA